MNDLVRSLVEIIGEAGSGAILSKDPLQGAITGASIETRVKGTVKAAESLSSFLRAREERRLSEAAGAIIARTAEKRSMGLDVRPDWNGDIDSRPEELVEQILRTVISETQERKVPYEAVIPVEVAFDESISLDDAFRLISLAASLSYMEMKILFALSTKNEWTFKSYDAGSPKHDPYLDSVLSLVYRNVLFPAGIGERYGGPFLSRVYLSPTGRALVRIMRLASLPSDEIDKVLVDLEDRRRNPYPA